MFFHYTNIGILSKEQSSKLKKILTSISASSMCVRAVHTHTHTHPSGKAIRLHFFLQKQGDGGEGRKSGAERRSKCFPCSTTDITGLKTRKRPDVKLEPSKLVNNRSKREISLCLRGILWDEDLEKCMFLPKIKELSSNDSRSNSSHLLPKP